MTNDELIQQYNRKLAALRTAYYQYKTALMHQIKYSYIKGDGTIYVDDADRQDTEMKEKIFHEKEMELKLLRAMHEPEE